MARAQGADAEPFVAQHPKRRLPSLSAVVIVASLAAIAWSLTWAGAAPPAHVKIPVRNTSGHANCSAEPGYPRQTLTGLFGRGGGSFPTVASIDANGCDSWTYELEGGFGPYTSFFAGPGFQAGQHAYQYGTQETTELLDGDQLIRVVNPTKEWLAVYAGYDVCTKSTAASGSTTTCIALAPDARPDDWVPWIAIGILLGAMVLFLIHFLRPNGPVRRKRHYRRVHHELIHKIPATAPEELDGVDVRKLQKRLRRLERAMSPELSESQRHWFSGLLTSGRHGMALESLARWMAESRTPIPDHFRDEALWLASSLKIEREVRPVLDAQVFAHEGDIEPATAPTTTGFDIPLEEFKSLVSEAVDSLPPAFGKAMTNVAIVVEEENPDRPLFGLYQGHSLAKARYRVWVIHPDKITIYRKTICEHGRSREQVRAQVYRTVIHEIAHHFGIDDPRLRELGW